MRKVVLLLLVLLVGCATVPLKTYEETVSGWTSYKDVEKWMRDNFTYDQGRLRELVRQNGGSIRSAPVTFKLKSGVCWDGARFVKEALDKINPAYESRIVWLDNGRDVSHYVCSFKIEGRLYVMDYSTVHTDMMGLFGPFDSLKEYQKFYASHHHGNISASYVEIVGDRVRRP